MRKIQRLALPAPTQKALNRKQSAANKKKAAGTLNIEATWKSARQTIPVKAALGVLQTMAGNRQRCMYCGDSHGTDIEHFWPVGDIHGYRGDIAIRADSAYGNGQL